MKKTIIAIPFLILVLFGLSCNTSKKENKDDDSTETKIMLGKTTYSIDTSGTSMKWTAYKFTDKLGVSGTFDELRLRLKTDSGPIDELLKNAEVTINTMSVNSGNEIRDPKLRTSFFNVFKMDTIFAKILDASDGNGLLELEMNDTSNDVALQYAIKNDSLMLSIHIDVLLWNGEEALKTLNKECYEVHTGTDGISKLWPDVDVVLKIPVKLESL